MKMDDFFRKLEDAIRDSWVEMATQQGAQIADAYKTELTTAIRGQKYFLPPLNKQYLERKRKLGLDLRKLIATGEYIKAIRVKLNGVNLKDLKITYEVSPPRTRIKPSKLNPRPSAKMTYEKLARIHEYGTRKIPARPHWRPTTAAFQAKAPGYSKAMQKVFLEKIDRKMARFMSSQGFGG